MRLIFDYIKLIFLTDVVIGFERLSYSVDEGVGQLKVCVVVSVPHQSDQLNRTFHLSVSTTPGTAGTVLRLNLYLKVA